MIFFLTLFDCNNPLKVEIWSVLQLKAIWAEGLTVKCHLKSLKLHRLHQQFRAFLTLHQLLCLGLVLSDDSIFLCALSFCGTPPAGTAGEAPYKKCACIICTQSCVGETRTLLRYYYFTYRDAEKKCKASDVSEHLCNVLRAALVCRLCYFKAFVQRFVIRLLCLPFHSTKAVYRNAKHLLSSIIPLRMFAWRLFICVCPMRWEKKKKNHSKAKEHRGACARGEGKSKRQRNQRQKKVKIRSVSRWTEADKIYILLQKEFCLEFCQWAGYWDPVGTHVCSGHMVVLGSQCCRVSTLWLWLHLAVLNSCMAFRTKVTHTHTYIYIWINPTIRTQKFDIFSKYSQLAIS